ncbi:HAMP domain-containing protein [Prauserella oleivorans]|uniref:histidine kinase n=1 Tax=Prauserella oleivorans TaxID=1478153 RepID=A0ABW5WIY6_9PSEU
MAQRPVDPPEAGLRPVLEGLVSVRDGDFTVRLPRSGDPLLDEIAAVFNDTTARLGLVGSEVTRIAREVGSEGRLGGVVSVPGAAGSWKELTDAVNAMAMSLSAQARDVTDVATAVSRGDLSRRITVDARGEPLALKNTTNDMVDRLTSVADEVIRVAREVGSEGRLGGQADVPGATGIWQELLRAVNFMAGNLTDQVRDIATVATAVAKGDLSQKITVDARGEILELKSTINTMVDTLSSFADEVTRVAREVGTDGRLGGQANVKGVAGTWRSLTESVNVMADNLTDQVRSIAQVATAVARGDLSQKITVEAKGEVAALAQTINTMVDTLSAFADEVTRVAREVGTEGRLGGQARVSNVAGTWKDLTDNVNSMASNLTGQVRSIAQVTTAVARGDLSQKIDVEARGEILELKTTINTMVDTLSAFASEVTRVAREVGKEGRLGGQAEVEGVSGTWKRLTENVNELAGNLTRQVRAIAAVTSAVATGDLTRSIAVEARGEVAELKDNINAMVQSLRETTRANEEHAWLNTSLAHLHGVLQGHRDLRAVTEAIMNELTPLVGAQYGTFYLVDSTQEPPVLRLTASYGGAADVPREFRLGESLVGQVARTRTSLRVDRTPPGYVRISSSLGSAQPVNLIVLPITFEDRTLGVIELASFTEFTLVQRDLLDQLTEVIGVNLNTIVANARTDALLDESQRLAAELRARSEELQAQQVKLRQSNADLEEKAALLARQNRDIELKNVEIEQARREIEQRAQQFALASKYKSEFLANMSHELRTPLTSLLILAGVLAQNAQGNLTPKQVEYAKVIESAGTDLLQLINDILDLSKVEAGKMDVHPDEVPLPQVLEHVRSTFSPLTAEKGLEFHVVVEDGVPERLHTDEQRLRQVLRNLLSNAVKFTERGRVELRVRSVDDGEPSVAFAVRDTGIGIAEEQLPAIFDAFQQADGTTSRGYGGTGLGLSISRQVANLLGGELTAESVLGEGSTFTLTVPVDPRFEAGSEPRRRLTAEPGMRILVVDADEDRLLTVLVRGFVRNRAGPEAATRIDSVPTPDEAIDALTTRSYHCAVVDASAGAPALTFLQRLAEPGRHRDVPVLVHATRKLSSAQSRLLDSQVQAGTAELFPSLDDLRDRLGAMFVPPATAEDSGSPRQERRPARESGLDGRKVLIVDDDSRNVVALTEMLALRGMLVKHAQNGREGIEMLRRNRDTDVILMDVMMPEMDGYATTAAIRAMPGFASLPIIMVTAKAMAGDREKSLAAGANDHITKPVHTDELLSCIERWLPE